MAQRKLTSGETVLARRIFGDSIAYDKVRVHDKKILGPLQEKECAVAYRSHISFPGKNASDDFSTDPDPEKQSVFIHELVHVWQHQNKVVFTPLESVKETLRTGFDYAKSYPYDLEPPKDLVKYRFEQQAAIIQDYFLLRHCDHPESYKARRKTAISPDLHRQYEAVLKNFLENPSYAAPSKIRAKRPPKKGL